MTRGLRRLCVMSAAHGAPADACRVLCGASRAPRIIEAAYRNDYATFARAHGRSSNRERIGHRCYN